MGEARRVHTGNRQKRERAQKARSGATAVRVEATAEDGGRRSAAKTALGFIGRPERDTPADSLSTPGRDNHLITPDAGRRAHAIPLPPFPRKDNKKEVAGTPADGVRSLYTVYRNNRFRRAEAKRRPRDDFRMRGNLYRLTVRY